MREKFIWYSTKFLINQFYSYSSQWIYIQMVYKGLAIHFLRLSPYFCILI